MTKEAVRRILKLTLALSSERDRKKLLSSILSTAMDITHCDAGALYLLDGEQLRCCRVQIRSLDLCQGGHDGPVTLPPVPLQPIHVCARAVLENRMINVPDVWIESEIDMSSAEDCDRQLNYRTESMLVVPLPNDHGELIGALQMVNALDRDGSVIPFSPEQEEVVEALGAQAAINLNTMQHNDQIRSLLDSLVGALSTAIDARTPYNANHTRNMVGYATNFLNWLEETGNPWAFDEERRQTFLLTVWLHDVGKLVVPLSVMNKETRLGDLLPAVEQRFVTMGLLARIGRLEGRLTEEEAEKTRQELEQGMDLVHRANRIGYLTDDYFTAVERLGRKTYVDENGMRRHWLTLEEINCLTIRTGTLTAEEREIMESHVVMTTRILNHVSFPKAYEEVPLWAGAHHELLNGEGYPDHLTARDIPKEVRLLTVLDIFDALTAKDRPYKKGMSVEKALYVLLGMAQKNELDMTIVNMFRESRAWEGMLPTEA